MAKELMMEAVKRRRAMLEDKGDENDPNEKDQELAPDAEGGTKQVSDARPLSHQNQTALGKEGFDHIDKSSAPKNSDDLFQDPKKDTHDPVDLNRDRNMAGDGSNSKYDKMGVDEHTDVRKQSSMMAKHNAMKGEAMKGKESAHVKASMDMPDNEPDHGESVVAGDQNPQMQKGFPAARSKMNTSGKDIAQDQDREGASDKGGLYASNDEDGVHDEEKKGMKGARAKLDGFLNKMKRT